MKHNKDILWLLGIYSYKTVTNIVRGNIHSNKTVLTHFNVDVHLITEQKLLEDQKHVKFAFSKH